MQYGKDVGEIPIMMSILDGLTARGILCWRENNMPVPIRRGRAVIGFRKADENKRGIPDIMACIGGRLIGIEVKRAGEKPDENQVRWGLRLKKAGAWHMVAYSWEDVATALNIK